MTTTWIASKVCPVRCVCAPAAQMPSNRERTNIDLKKMAHPVGGVTSARLQRFETSWTIPSLRRGWRCAYLIVIIITRKDPAMARALVALLLDLLLSECDPPLFKLAASTTPPIPVRERLDFVCALGRVILYYRQIEIMQIVARPPDPSATTEQISPPPPPCVRPPLMDSLYLNVF